MDIAVVGAGNIGGTLGRRWAEAGHRVTFGLRDPSKREGALPVADALAGAEVVLLAVPGRTVTDLVREHAAALDGKVVVDATNTVGGPISRWDEIQPLIPRAQLVRAFNSVGWEMFADPVVGGVQADLFYAAAEGRATEVAERLIQDVGLRPVRVGGPEVVGAVDGFLPLYINLARRLGRRVAFKLLSE